MTPRPRKSGRRGWPENLYAINVRGKTYYRYRHPGTGRFHGMGADFKKASAAARKLNAKLMDAPDAESLVANVMQERETVDRWLERYRDEILPQQQDRHGRKIAAKTLEEYGRTYTDAATAWKGKPITDLRRRDVVDHLSQYATVSGNRRRSHLSKAFARAVADGLIESNPVEGTLAQTEVVERERLTMDGFRAIRELADPWMVNALDLAIMTLQRREDLVSMRFDDIKDGYLCVRQHKVEGHGTGLIRIKIGPEMEHVINRCRDNLVSPYLIHRRPTQQRKEDIKAKDHWTQVAKDYLSKEFARLRKKAGIKATTGTPPSLHEVRSLGAEQYRKAGWPEDAIQRLLGHSSSRMTSWYLRGHEERWVDADGGLPLSEVLQN